MAMSWKPEDVILVVSIKNWEWWSRVYNSYFFPSTAYPYAWRWWIAHSILWIIKGGFWLGVFVLVVLFKSFPAKHGCTSPIVLYETPEIHHDWHGRSSSVSVRDWQLFWEDKFRRIKTDLT